MARKRFLKTKILSALVVGLVVLLLILNPSEAKHRDAIYDQIRRQAEADNGAAGALLATALKSLDPLQAAPMQRTNYLLFSTTSLGLGVDKYKTIGALGYVYVYK